jgi:peptidyl-tRNA hydrolase, PTH1 family
MLGRDRTGTPADLLVVGLGNPGSEYSSTRHNVGADVVALLAANDRTVLKLGKERALAAEIRIGQARLAIAFPQTFMNLSGESVRMLVKRHGIDDFRRLVVIHDELDLPSARIKLKFGGGNGGHNGLKSIQAHLSSPDFIRLRLGIGRPPGRQDPADYVLKRPGKAERELLDVAVREAADIVEALLNDGFERTMNRVNTDPKSDPA